MKRDARRSVGPDIDALLERADRRYPNARHRFVFPLAEGLPPLDKTYHIARGDCLCSSGQLLHGARPVTGGTRFVLVAFIDELQEEAMEVEEGGEMEVDWRAQGFS